MSTLNLDFYRGGVLVEALDVIKQLCKEKGISLAQLENDLDYGNGSLAKSKSMSADRMFKIAQYFNVSMEYLMTGKTIDETDDEVASLRQQQSILIEINKISRDMAEYYKKINECQSRLSALQAEYNKLELKKKKKGVEDNKSDKIPDYNLFDIFNLQTSGTITLPGEEKPNES